MKQKLAKLINVKSIVTLVLTLIFAVLALNKSVSSGDFMEVFKLIIIFYFGTQVGKNETENTSKKV